MQVFVPYASPLETAKCLDPKRLNRQIQEALVILDAIEGTGKGWFNHPIVKTYAPYKEWLDCYMRCLRNYRSFILGSDWLNPLGFSEAYDELSNRYTPPFLTEEFCDQHKRRLYTKDKEYYKQFAEYYKKSHFLKKNVDFSLNIFKKNSIFILY